MSNIVATKARVKGLCTHKINNSEFVNELEHTYHALLMSNYGPNSNLTLVRNAAENDFLTASSSTLIQQLPFSHPCFKFINALIMAQSKAHGVYGLFVGALCSGLLFKSLKLEDSISHRVLCDTTDYIQQILINYLTKEKDKYSFKVDIGKLQQLLCIVRSVINSKSCQTLLTEEREFIAVKTIEAFLQTIPQGDHRDFGRVLISTSEGSSPLSSRVIDGMLYREPEYTADELHSLLARLSKPLKVVIFTVPLSHDVDEKNLLDWKLKSSARNAFSSYLFDTLRKLKAKNVQLIACQKFIDPGLKFDLEKDGFLVLERLGSANTSFLTDMASCCPISAVAHIDSLQDSQIGCVSTVQGLTIGEKVYINILPLKPYRNVTLALIGNSCHSLDYLKESIDASITLLQRMVADSSVLCGAGCFETFLASYLTEVKQRVVHQLAQTFDTTSSNIFTVFNMYIDMFLRLAIMPSGGKSAKLLDYFVDSEYHHLWATDKNIPSQVELSSEINSLTENIGKTCACKCICKENMSKGTQFIPLLHLKDNEFQFWSRSNEDSVQLNTESRGNEDSVELNSKSRFSKDSVQLNSMSGFGLDSAELNLKSRFNEDYIELNTNTKPGLNGISGKLNLKSEFGEDSTELNSKSRFNEDYIKLNTNTKPGLNETSGKLNSKSEFGEDSTELNSLPRFDQAKLSLLLKFESCVLDSCAAKVNALQFAFDGFSELLKIGICVFDN